PPSPRRARPHSVPPEDCPMTADLKHAARSNTARSSEPAPANIADTPGSHVPGGHANGAEAATHVASDDPGADEVLDVDGATKLLRIGRNTIYELVGRNEIPHRRLGKQIRFSRAAIMRWLDSWSSQDAKEGQ